MPTTQEQPLSARLTNYEIWTAALEAALEDAGAHYVFAVYGEAVYRSDEGAADLSNVLDVVQRFFIDIRDGAAAAGRRLEALKTLADGDERWDRDRVEIEAGRILADPLLRGRGEVAWDGIDLPGAGPMAVIDAARGEARTIAEEARRALRIVDGIWKAVTAAGHGGALPLEEA